MPRHMDTQPGSPEALHETRHEATVTSLGAAGAAKKGRSAQFSASNRFRV